MENISFVCCVESGGLEQQTLRMAESLRLFGGRFADAPLYAVTPRLGPPLSRKTVEGFKRLKVEYLRFRSGSWYSWNHFMNKPEALLAVDRQVNTEAIGWLDSDVIFVGEPDQLALMPEESFVACPSDAAGATQGKGDPLEPYWEEIAKVLGLDIDQLPWVVTDEENARVRYYFNSGVFVYRRQTDFAKRYLEHCMRILEARLSSRLCSFFFTDQVALGLTAAKLGLPWRRLAHSHNYSVCSQIYAERYSREKMSDARIVHYHDGMWPPFWNTLLQCLRDTHPQAADWLTPQGPLTPRNPIAVRLMGKILKEYRLRQSAAYGKTCAVL